MSILDDFNKAQNKLRAKKKENAILEDFYAEQKKIQSEKKEKPLYTGKTAALYEDDGDIAPITTTTKQEERKWFQKGEFEDGYQLGDITKTILGTKTDISENLLAGVLGMGEKAVDAGAYIVGGVGGLFGNDDLKDKMSGFIKKDLYDEENVAKKIIGVSASSMLNDMIGVDSEDSSVLGEKSDALVQSAGQLAGTLGLQAVGVPWLVTSGVVGFGSEAENALNQGATYGQAGMSAAISAGAEILTEKLFGGSGLGETGLIAVDRLTKGITNKAVKALADYGVDILAEGSEEVISEFMSNLGSSLYKEKKLGEILFSEEAIDGYIESFIGGGVLGGVMNASNAVSSVKSGRDYRSGLSVNEQKVVEKEVESRIAEQEQGGKKLTDKEKAALEEAVIRDMERGYISTDTIEEVLGGESYNTYKRTVDSEDALLKEYEELGNKQNATLAEQTRYNELHQQVQDLKQNSKRDLYKTTLSENVFRTVQNDRLTESYNEKARRGQAFETDLTKYNTKQQETIKKAVESGILNNTNRTHEFVDMIAKITADKGVLFDFTNNERLKESGFAVEDKQVNGYVTKDGVTLNIDSAKSLNSVVGHEITHVLEGTELYTALQSAVVEYAKSKGDYQARYDSLSKLYQNVEGADVNAELTADLVGDYLFTDTDFINNLSVQHRNVFQKIYDEIKYLCKVATAGSKEARELEKVKRAFEKAYQESGKQQDDDGDTKYSLVEDQETIDFLENQDYIVTYKAMQVIDGKLYPPMSAETKVTEEYTDKKGNKKTKTVRKLKQPSELGRWQKSDENRALAEQKYDPKKGYSSFDLLKGNGKTISAAYNPYEHTSNIVLNDQFEEAYNRPNLVTVEYHIPVSELTSGYKAEYAKDAVGQHSWKSGPVAKDLENPRQVYLTRWSKPVRILPDSEVAAKYKEILDGTGLSVPFNVVTPSLLSELEKAGVAINYDGSPMYQSIQRRAAEKKAKYSLTDSEGVQLSKEQQEYFKDSKARDENGRLQVVYHGSKNSGFNVFRYSKDIQTGTDYGEAYYFTSDRQKASGYSYDVTKDERVAQYKKEKDALRDKFLQTRSEEDKNAYLNYKLDGKSLFDLMGDESYLTDGGEVKEVYLNLTNPLIADAGGKYYFEVYPEYFEQARANGNDGIIVKNVIDNPRGEARPIDTYIAFKQEQIKNTDNTKPTVDKDIRYSLSEYTAEEKKAHNKVVLEHFGKTYKWAETGYVLLDGSRLDLSGKHEGAPGGYRTVDHRDIVDALGSDYGGDSYSGSLVQFMSEGNIRISPESNGINLSVKPNKAQEQALSNFIFNARGEVMLDIDDSDGYTVVSVEYPRGTHANKVLNDIRGWFDNGTKPEVSNLSPFRSLTKKGETPKPYGKYNVYGKDMKLETAPVANTDFNTQPVSNTESNTPNALNADEDEYLNQLSELRDKALTQAQELDRKKGRTEEESFQMQRLYQFADELMLQIEGRVNELFPDDMAPMADDAERLDSLTDADMPPAMEAPYTEDEDVTVDDPFEERDWYQVGNRKVNAYMYENPEVKPFFQEEAAMLLAELNDTIKGEKWYNDDLYYETNGEQGFGGVRRLTSDSIAEMLDGWGMSYADIEKGLNAILEDHGAENIAAAKKIEFMLNDRLLNGYKDFYSNGMTPPNEEYINLLNEKQITEYSTEAFDAFMANADQYAPPVEEDIAPVPKPPKSAPYMAFNAPVEKYEAIRPKRAAQPRMARATPEEQARADILVDEPKVDKKKKNGLWNWAKVNLIDPGTVFETLSLKSGNPELQAKFSSIKRAESRAQRHMENGNGMSSSLKSIREGVEKTGKTKQFYEYLYHLHNADRMTLEDRYMDVENKPVFGSSITAHISNLEVAELEKRNPEFKRLAQEVYNYMGNLREMLVEGGVISEETAQLWQEMYPHYVPIRREGHDGVNINVPLDTGRTGINAPIKRATGGNSNILPLFDTMAMRTQQTFKAIAKNRFGVELKNTLGTTIENAAVDVDEAIDSIDTHEELLQEGKNGRSPTFTVFENGEKVTFEITDEMYDAMKPKSGAANINIKALNAANNLRRGLITEYNPVFAITNPIKDIQDVLINSKHPARTYANMPKAIGELMSNGHWYREYLDNGGEQNTYFEGETNTFVKEKSTLRKVVGFPIDKLSQVNNFIEKVPRLAEYIASRKAGRSIDVSMLDAARVTTDFSAGGHITKMMNRNGFTFLNASVQGAVQQVRNIREAKHNGLKGWAQLAAKTVAAGLPAILLNHLLWEDDEEYEELSDYVKQNYYIVGKFGDGKFVRIPKGRTLAVIQNGFEQMEKLITGNDEADLEAFTELVISNLAPNNPLDNNIIAPIAQALRNETWYGEDLVPTRLQDLPSAEQYDESTDVISRWLGERTPFSPYKINYLLDQYSGGIGDTFLPMLTPEAESGDDTLKGYLLAPLRDKFTTDSVMNNQNVSDFYDKKDELTVNANATGATEEDVLKNKYMNSVNADLAKLYAEKRKIQNSDLPDAEKYAAVRDVQSQIVALTRESLGTYENISYEEDDIAVIGDKYFKQNDEGEWSKLSDDQVRKHEITSEAGDAPYATDGDIHYRYYEPDEDSTAEAGWRKLTDEQVEKQEEVTKGLGISAEEYWGNKEEYDYAYEHPESYAVAKAVGGYEAYRGYSSEMYDIKADKDSNGKSISGSRKEKIWDYVNGLDIEDGEKYILFKKEYNADDTYNYEIIDYLNSREDISYEDMATILKKLGFTVSANGDISW